MLVLEMQVPEVFLGLTMYGVLFLDPTGRIWI